MALNVSLLCKGLSRVEVGARLQPHLQAAFSGADRTPVAKSCAIPHPSFTGSCGGQVYQKCHSEGSQVCVHFLFLVLFF